jgi:hypothetical protein
MVFLEFFILVCVGVSSFFAGKLAQQMIQQSERHDHNERVLRRVVKHLETASK